MSQNGEAKFIVKSKRGCSNSEESCKCYCQGGKRISYPYGWINTTTSIQHHSVGLFFSFCLTFFVTYSIIVINNVWSQSDLSHDTISYVILLQMNHLVPKIVHQQQNQAIWNMYLTRLHIPLQWDISKTKHWKGSQVRPSLYLIKLSVELIATRTWALK